MTDEPSGKVRVLPPQYMLQHNALNRSSHKLSATASKLTAMAMALLPSDLSSLTVTFTFTDFCKAVGYEKGGESYRIFKDAVKECMGSVIYVETDPDEQGKKEWKMFTWFTMAEYSEKTGQANMTFSAELAAFLSALKWVYTRIDLRHIGALQSRYGIHLYEYLISYAYLKGKQEEESSEWYVQLDVSDLRFILGTPHDAYKQTHLFKQKVIERPVNEINDAGIGLDVTISGIRDGRRLMAIRFDCKQVPKRLAAPDSAPSGEEAQRSHKPRSRETQKRLPQRAESPDYFGREDLRARYPDEFKELCAQELAKAVFGGFRDDIKAMTAFRVAEAKLAARHGIVR